jgi:hypothetical protein
VPLFCFCSFRYYLKGGGGDVFPLFPPLKSRGCGFTYGPDFFFHCLLMRSPSFLPRLNRGCHPPHALSPHSFRWKGESRKILPMFTLFLARKYSSLCPKLFYFLGENGGVFWVGTKNFSPRETLFRSAKGCSSLLGRSFRRSLKFLLNLSLLKCYNTVNCEVVMTDFAIWVNMKNARFCNVFDRFCKIFFA